MKKINLMTPIGGGSLGVIGCNILKALRSADIEASLFPIGEQISFNDQKELDLCGGSIRYARNFSYKAPTIKLWHPHELAIKPGKGKYYGWIFLETDDLTASDIHNIKCCDTIIVSAEWMKDVLFRYKTHKHITVVPNAVDCEIFDRNILKDTYTENYVFFSYGCWDLRNGYDFLIKAFNVAFTPKDKVELRILPYNEFLKDEELQVWLKIVSMSPIKDKISIYNRMDTQHDLAHFISQADCGIFTHRLATYGNPVLETMAMNKPIIITNYRSYIDYCDPENSFLINIPEEEKAYDGRLLFGTGNWAKLGKSEFDTTVDYLRYVHKNHVTTNENGVNTATKFSINNMGQNIDQILSKVEGFNVRRRAIKRRPKGVS